MTKIQILTHIKKCCIAQGSSRLFAEVYAESQLLKMGGF